ncbi:MAG: response regulator [Candidatus Goldbacteria bacterium]|nr:response regulator [Candidatus Goldiibacteriota bacterium]
MERKKILLAEDESSVMCAIVETLSPYYDVKAVENGKKAVETAEKNVPDLIILDIMMPVMDGITACRVIRSKSSLRKVPVMFLTARGQVTDVENGFNAGADSYIIKPFSAAVLLKKIETVFSKVSIREKIKR